MRKTALAELKTAVPITTVARAIGLDLFRRGKYMVTYCPFHNDQDGKNPNMVLYTDGHYKCYRGGCGAYGDSVDLVQGTLGIKLTDAAELVASLAGWSPADLESKPMPGQSYALPPLSQEEFDHYISRCQSTLNRTHKAVTYLHERGLTDTTIARFRLGYDDGSCLTKQIRTTDENILYAPYKDRIIIPVLDQEGKAIYFAGRRLHENTKGPKYKNAPGHMPGPFNYRPLPAVILVEGPIDAITLEQAGIPAISGFGTESVRSAWADLLTNTHVTILFDNDEPGQEAATKVAKMLAKQGIHGYIKKIPREFHDINEFYCKDPAGFRRLFVKGK